MCPGHYFDADPAVPSRPGAVELSLPDFHARLAVDRGVFSGGPASTRAPSSCSGRRRPRPPRATCWTWAAGTARSPARWPSGLPRRWCGRWTSTTGPSTSPPATPPPSVWPSVRAVRPDGVPASVRFAGLWSNPPIRIGKVALHQLLGDWLPRLEPDGRAWMVVHRHLGGDSLAAWLGTRGLGRPPGRVQAGLPDPRGGPAVNARQLGPTDLKRLHRQWNRRTPGRLALLLDGVQSPYNIGRHRPHRGRLPGRAPLPGR